MPEATEKHGDKSFIEPEIVHFSSYDGKTIEAALLRPRDYDKNKGVPAVILIHGGPAGRWSDRFNSWGQLLAARGYAVLYPNIRGSTGYGHDFMTLNKEDWGGGDYKDIMAGLDYIIERGIAEPERVGLGLSGMSSWENTVSVKKLNSSETHIILLIVFFMMSSLFIPE